MSPPDAGHRVPPSPRRLLPSAAGPFRHRGAVFRLLGLSPEPAAAPRPAGAVPPVGFRYRSGALTGSGPGRPFTTVGPPPERPGPGLERLSPGDPAPRVPAISPSVTDTRPGPRQPTADAGGAPPAATWKRATERSAAAPESGSGRPEPETVRSPGRRESQDLVPTAARPRPAGSTPDPSPPEPVGPDVAIEAEAAPWPDPGQLEAAWALVKRLGGRLPHRLPLPEEEAPGPDRPPPEAAEETPAPTPEAVEPGRGVVERRSADPAPAHPAPPRSSAERSPTEGEPLHAPASLRSSTVPRGDDERAQRERVDRVCRATGELVTSAARSTGGGGEPSPVPEERRPKPRRSPTPPVTTVVVRRPPRPTRSPVAFWRRNRLDTFRLRPVR